jgi:hypothetical protein
MSADSHKPSPYVSPSFRERVAVRATRQVAWSSGLWGCLCITPDTSCPAHYLTDPTLPYLFTAYTYRTCLPKLLYRLYLLNLPYRIYLPPILTAHTYRIYLPHIRTEFTYRTYLPHLLTEPAYRNYLLNPLTETTYRNYLPHIFTEPAY